MDIKKFSYIIGGCIFSGVRNPGGSSAPAACRSLPSSGSHMFCQKSQETSQLVPWNQTLQEKPGNLCGGKGNDQTDKNQNHGHCDPTYGSGVCP